MELLKRESHHTSIIKPCEFTQETRLPFTKLTLPQLYPEVLTHIFSFLEAKDKGRVSQSCHYFNQVLKNKQVWKNTEARLNLRPGQTQTYSSMNERGITKVQVLSLKRSLRELTTNVKVTQLKLSGCYNVTDSSLNSMQILPSLVELDLSLCKQITDAGLIHILGKAPNLVSLDLGGCCNITDRSCLLISYGLRSLKKLDLRSCYHITDRALSYLAGEVKITERCEIKTYNFLARIGLINCDLCKRPSNKNRLELRKIDENTKFGMKCLESLVLQDCQKISDVSLHFISRFSSLQNLNLSFCVNITDNGLRALSPLGPSLTELNLRSCDNISDQGFQNLRDCFSITHLDVSFCDKISTLNYQVCKNLRTLSLSACDVTDDSLIGIRMEKLGVLNLGQCGRITDQGLKRIREQCPNLKYVDLYGCAGISTRGLQDIMTMPKLKHVNLGLWKV